MEDAVYTWQCGQKDGCDLGATKIPGGQNEYPRIAFAQCGNLQRAISQPLIFRQYNPATLSDDLQPDTVFLVASEMIVVNLHAEARTSKLRSDRLYAQRPVDKEYAPVRRLRSGWLLRSHWSPDGSPALSPPPSRRPCIARRSMQQVCRFQRPPGARTKLPDS